MFRQTHLLFAATLLICFASFAHGFAPPPNPAIAYVELPGGRSIRVANSDGSNSRIVVTFPSGTLVQAPCWSPDNTQLVFYGGNPTTGHGLWIVNVDGTGLHQIVTFTQNPGGITYPDWSRTPAPDGQYKIAFSMEGIQLPALNLHRRDIFIVNPDGTGLQNLTSSSAYSETFACWSNDGTRVYHDGNGLVAIDLAMVDGQLAVTGRSTLSSLNSFTHLRSGSGSKLCFAASSPNSSVMRIYTFDTAISGAVPVRLTTSTSTSGELWPSFSPDGTKLAFELFNSGIYTINANGTGQRRVVAQGYQANWRR